METPAPTQVNKKELKAVFKEVYNLHDTEKTKEVPTDLAAKIVVECMKKANISYCEDQAKKILVEFDIDSNGLNSKKEVKRALMIAATIEEKNDIFIKKLKFKWRKKQLKKKNSTPEAKIRIKAAKKVIKAEFKTTFKSLPKENKKQISHEQAHDFFKTIIEKTETKLDEEKIKEIIAKLDMNGKNYLTKKDCKLGIQHLVGYKEIDFDDLAEKKQKWLVKRERKEKKKLVKQEKKLAKKTRKASIPKSE